jgi:IS1 family transposase/lambda repressor-like predicted transcriptional regulator
MSPYCASLNKCGTSFSDKQPLDNLRVDFKQACTVAKMLCEGIGIRAVSRLTGLHQQTVLNVLARAGSKAGRFLDATVKNVQPESVQADEMFCFVGCKDRANLTHDPFRGSQYLFMAMDSKSKLIISHVIGQRSPQNTERLLNDLKQRVTGRMTLITDGFEAYKIAVPRTIGKDVDFAQLVKRYANPRDINDPDRRYSPTRCIGARKVIRRGNPDMDLISTSYMERANLTVRLFNRRFTRLTLGYSKKFEYLMHSINLMIFHFNFMHVHATHGKTPAMEAGLKSSAMTFEEMLLAPE